MEDGLECLKDWGIKTFLCVNRVDKVVLWVYSLNIIWDSCRYLTYLEISTGDSFCPESCKSSVFSLMAFLLKSMHKTNLIKDDRFYRSEVKSHFYLKVWHHNPAPSTDCATALHQTQSNEWQTWILTSVHKNTRSWQTTCRIGKNSGPLSEGRNTIMTYQKDKLLRLTVSTRGQVV